MAAAMLASTAVRAVTYGGESLAAAGRAARSFLRARKPPPYRHGPDARSVDVELGHRLRQARLLAGLSRKELAVAIGVGAQSVRGYETGARPMPPARLVAAATVLGVSISWFFRGDDAPGKGRRPRRKR